jgi:hypothetical protein
MCGPVSQLTIDTMNNADNTRAFESLGAGGPQIAARAGVLTHLSVQVRRRRLDEALAGGAPPETASVLALRARQLTRLSNRRTIADGLRRMVRETAAGTPPSRARISPRRSQVRAACGELTRLADALATPGPVAARGVAEAWILLTDGAGPLYNANSPASVSTRAASAADDLRVED